MSIIILVVMGKEGLLNSLINKLPVELHLPGYNYCGPGTKLEKRLLRGDKGVNLLDEYCKIHDIAYSKSLNIQDRHKADKILIKMAKKRETAQNASTGEKIAAKLVNKAMLAKVSSGAGLKSSFKNMVSYAKKHIHKLKPKCKNIAIKLAMAAAKEMISNSESVPVPRIIPAPKTGGFLPLIPLFAGLSATGSLGGGVAGIAKAITGYRSALRRLEKLEKRNKRMEAVTIGEGLHLKPYKNGFGIYVSDKKKNF